MLQIELGIFKAGLVRQENGGLPMPFVEFNQPVVEVDEFLKTATNFTEQFKIEERFKYSPAQLDLFEKYFAGYFALKSETTTRPFMDRLLSFGRETTTKDELGREYIDAAIELEKLMETDPAQSLINLFTELYQDYTKDEIMAWFKDGNGQLSAKNYQRLQSQVGLPIGIQRTANYLSSLWVNKDKLIAYELIERVDFEIDDMTKVA